MERWQNRVAVVTGASSGIGSSIAKDLVTAGFQVVALGRREERLNENRLRLPKDLQKRLYILKCDVTNEVNVRTTFEWIENTLGGTDVLVNNAGVMHIGNLLEMDIALVDDIINTNIKGLIYCAQAAFKSMKSRKFDGHIININSIAGHRVYELFSTSMNMYSPSKFAVTAINDTFRNELRNFGTKIKTTSISPGAVRTEIAPSEKWDELGLVLNPEDISQVVMFALSTPPHVQIHEIVVKPVGEVLG